MCIHVLPTNFVFSSKLKTLQNVNSLITCMLYCRSRLRRDIHELTPPTISAREIICADYIQIEIWYSNFIITKPILLCSVLWQKGVHLIFFHKQGFWDADYFFVFDNPLSLHNHLIWWTPRMHDWWGFWIFWFSSAEIFRLSSSDIIVESQFDLPKSTKFWCNHSQIVYIPTH